MAKVEVRDNYFILSNQEISYIMFVDQHNILTHVFYGKYIEEATGLGVYPRIRREFEVNFPENNPEDRAYSIGNLPLEYSFYGTGEYREPNIVLEHEDGSTTSDFRFDTYRIEHGKEKISNFASTYADNSEQAETLVIVLVDKVKSIELELYYTIFDNHNVIVRSVKVLNKGQQTSNILKIASGNLDLGPRDLELVQLNGTWARERMVEREAIHTGIKRLDSKRGTSSHQQTPFVGALEPDANEHQGEVYGLQLVYSGSHLVEVEKDPYQQIRVQLGIQPLGFKWHLKPGEEFRTPELVMTYSQNGLNGMSQSFHDFLKDHLIPSKFKNMERPVLINNWEGTYFDFTEDKLKALIDQAKEMELELFVLDDGWFGSRNDDDSSLGDWYVNEPKLPNGLDKIADYAHEQGLKFGLWFEPEMISEDSDLFRAHPDWAIQTPDRKLSTGRGQYVIDFSRQDVRDNIFDQMSAILDNVEIDYIKWDMNRHLSEVYSLALPTEQAGEVVFRFYQGLYEFLEKLVNKYPNILFESCSGGGGRFDLGLLAYMPQTWTSDNTDAYQRLKIQYGTSMIVPINTMGSHVSAVPNHQTNRVTSLKMRGSVAMNGVFGYELDLTQLSEEEIDVMKEQIAFYKQHRKLILEGKFTRLISPFNNNACAWSITSHDGNESLVSYYEVLNEASKPLRRLRLKDLNATTIYKVLADKQEFTASGAELMNIGFYVFPQLEHDFDARVYYISEVN